MTRKKEIDSLIARYRADIGALVDRKDDMMKHIEILENLIPAVLVWYMWKIFQSMEIPASKGTPIPQNDEIEKAKEHLTHLEDVLQELREAVDLLKEEEIRMRKRVEELEMLSEQEDQFPDDSTVPAPVLTKSVKPESQKENLKVEEPKGDKIKLDDDTDLKKACKDLLKRVSELNANLKKSSQKLKENESYAKRLENEYSRLEKELQEKIKLLETKSDTLRSKIFDDKEKEKYMQEQIESKQTLSAMQDALTEVRSMKETVSKSGTVLKEDDIEPLDKVSVQDKSQISKSEAGLPGEITSKKSVSEKLEGPALTSVGPRSAKTPYKSKSLQLENPAVTTDSELDTEMVKSKEIESLIARYKADITALEDRKQNLLTQINVTQNLIPTVFLWYMSKVYQGIEIPYKHRISFPKQEIEEEARDKLEHLKKDLTALQEAVELIEEEEEKIERRIKELEQFSTDSSHQIGHSVPESPLQEPAGPTSLDTPVLDKLVLDSPVLDAPIVKGDKDQVSIFRLQPDSRLKPDYKLQPEDTNWKKLCEGLVKQVGELNKKLKESSQQLRQNEDYAEEMEEKCSKLEKELEEKIKLLGKKTSLLKSKGKEQEKSLNEELKTLSAMEDALTEVRSIKESLSKITTPSKVQPKPSSEPVTSIKGTGIPPKTVQREDISEAGEVHLPEGEIEAIPEVKPISDEAIISEESRIISPEDVSSKASITEEPIETIEQKEDTSEKVEDQLSEVDSKAVSEIEPVIPVSPEKESKAVSPDADEVSKTETIEEPTETLEQKEVVPETAKDQLLPEAESEVTPQIEPVHSESEESKTVSSKAETTEELTETIELKEGISETADDQLPKAEPESVTKVEPVPVDSKEIKTVTPDTEISEAATTEATKTIEQQEGISEKVEGQLPQADSKAVSEIEPVIPDTPEKESKAVWPDSEVSTVSAETIEPKEVSETADDQLSKAEPEAVSKVEPVPADSKESKTISPDTEVSEAAITEEPTESIELKEEVPEKDKAEQPQVESEAAPETEPAPADLKKSKTIRPDSEVSTVSAETIEPKEVSETAVGQSLKTKSGSVSKIGPDPSVSPDAEISKAETMEEPIKPSEQTDNVPETSDDQLIKAESEADPNIYSVSPDSKESKTASPDAEISKTETTEEPLKTIEQKEVIPEKAEDQSSQTESEAAPKSEPVTLDLKESKTASSDAEVPKVETTEGSIKTIEQEEGVPKTPDDQSPKAESGTVPKIEPGSTDSKESKSVPSEAEVSKAETTKELTKPIEQKEGIPEKAEDQSSKTESEDIPKSESVTPDLKESKIASFDSGIPQGETTEKQTKPIEQKEGVLETADDQLPMAESEEVPKIELVSPETKESKIVPSDAGISKAEIEPDETIETKKGIPEKAEDQLTEAESEAVPKIESDPAESKESKIVSPHVGDSKGESSKPDTGRPEAQIVATKPEKTIPADTSPLQVSSGEKEPKKPTKSPSGLSLAAEALQSKLLVKDHLIRAMADQLRELARHDKWPSRRAFEEVVSTDPIKTYDFDKNSLLQYLKGQEPPDYADALKGNKGYSSSNPLTVKVINKVDQDSLMIEWGPQPPEEVVGFQIFVNGQFKYWVHSARRNVALLHPLDLKILQEIAVSPINEKGDMISRSSITYKPE